MSNEKILTNIERFIHEVSIRPCIWNTRCLDYKNKNKRKETWEDICNVFFSNYNSKNNDRKEHLCRMVQKKWKALRDTYVRNIRKNRRMTYVYANSLSFLGDNIKIKKPFHPKPNTDGSSDYNPDEEEQCMNEEDDEENSIFKTNPLLDLNDTNQSMNSNRFTEHLEVQTLIEPNIPSSSSEHYTNADKYKSDDKSDEDRLFLLSLLKDLKKVPDYNKLEAKSELLLVLNKWKKSNVEFWCSDQNKYA